MRQAFKQVWNEMGFEIVSWSLAATLVLIFVKVLL